MGSTILLVVAALVLAYFVIRSFRRAASINAVHGKRFDSWGRPLETDDPFNLYYRIPNAAGMIGPFSALYVGRDLTGRRVCAWWDQEAERILLIRPGGGRWLGRRDPPRPIGEAELTGMKERAQRHAEWLQERREMGISVTPFGSLPRD